MMRSLPTALVLLSLLVPPTAGAAPQTKSAKKASKEVSQIVFEGNQSIKEPKLRKVVEEELEEFKKDPRSSFLDDAAFEIAAHYRDLGYASVEVEFEREPVLAFGEAPTPPVRVVFKIQEGPRTRIEDLRFEGGDSYSQKELLSFFPSARGGLLSLEANVFSERQLADEAEDLEDFYRGNGFLDAEVGPLEVDLGEDGRQARILVPIEEGQLYRLEDVELLGFEEIPERIRQQLLAPFLGTPFHPRYPFEIRGRFQDSFAKEGYAEAEVKIDRSMDPDTGEVRLTLTAEEGPQIVVSSIEIEGNRRTREEFILSQLAFEPGQRYSLELERESFRRLYRTGLFRRVRISLAEGEGAQRALTVTLDEYSTREVFIEPGYGSYEGFRLRVGVKERNLFGTGSRLRGDATAAQRALRARATYSDPWTILPDLTTEISLDANQRELDGFTSAKYGAGAALIKDWTDKLSSTLGYQYRRSESQDVEAGRVGGVSERDVDISSLRLSSRFDDRDNLFAPRSGNLAELGLEYATKPLGSQLEFFRFRLSASTYFGLGEKTTLAFGLRAGAIYPVRLQDAIPLQERYFSGGENSVRAFRENDLLPVGPDGLPLVDEDGNSQGGEAFATGTVELRQQIWGNLEAAAFVDSGALVPDASDLTDPFEIRTGVGVGLRYLLPIGPVRLDGAWKTDAKPGEDTFVLHFAVGMAI